VTLGAQGPHCANSSSKALPSLRSRVSKPSGAEVWGTSGEIGYSVDGSHAELIAVPVASLRRKPKRLSFEQAAAIGVTYLAAWLGVVEYAQLASGETLLVIGAGGGVGGGRRHKSENGGEPMSLGLTDTNRHRIRPQHALWTSFLSLEPGPSSPLLLAQRAARDPAREAQLLDVDHLPLRPRRVCR
jgi:hypothetical protein